MRTVTQVILSMASGALGAVLVVMNASPRSQGGSDQVVRCQRVEIVDPQGSSRVILGVDSSDYAGIQVMNKSGKECIRLSVRGDGRVSNLVFRDGEAVLLSATAKGGWGTTITLGGPSRSRMIVGAIPSDVEGSYEESADWGVQVRGATSIVPVVSLNVHTDLSKGTSAGGIVITDPTGKAREIR